ncbi:muts domain V-domain-containing protein [Armillaria luteobubalina]|uniref:Muts domain V-domain-containing protein n=1 Tax=Armillaria luteobubalina TaxID=153913 RepID=A0AA39QP38_9AGAR|nr:muts domain V-domain-containing protein [Armillaria luteobubalina]
MVLLPTAVRCLRRVPLYAGRVSVHALRAFASRAQDQVASEEPTTLKTKKKYSDLPLARVLPDGSVAPPLPEWISDQVTPMRKARGRALKSLEITNSDDFVDTEPIKRTKRKSSTVDDSELIVVVSRKRRSKKTDAEDSIEADTKSRRRVRAATVDDSEESKPRKRVKKATIKQTEDEDAPPKRIRRKPLVTDEEVPKPRRRSKKLDAVEEIHETTKSRKRAKKSPEEAEAESTPRRRRSRKAVEDVNDENSHRKRTKKAAGAESDKAVAAAAQPKALFEEIQENLTKFPHCVLLTRVGQFYESYFDQAIEVSRLLNIKLTTRKWNKQFIPMCGFPLVHIDKHLKVLVQQNQRFVAMCEEFPRYRSSGEKDFDRRVVRVITPGTLIDESFLNQYENNYLLAINASISLPLNDSVEPQQYPIGLAWIDVSTGEFFSKKSDSESLRDDIARIGPREIVLHKDFDGRHTHPIFMALGEERNLISYAVPSDEFTRLSPVTSAQDASGTDEKAVADDMTDVIDVTDEVLEPARKSAVYTAEEGSAITLLTAYLEANLLEHMPALSYPDQDNGGNRMYMDSHTIKALEIRENIIEGGTTGSLLSVIKRTVTSSGTRLLVRWLCSPSTSIPEIEARQSLVEFFCSRPYFREDLVGALAKLEDASRIVQKFLLGRGDTSDLLAVHTTIETWSHLKFRIERERLLEAQEREENFSIYEWSSLDSLMTRFSDLDELGRRIGSAVERTDVDADEPVLEDEVEDAEPAFFKWRYGPSKWVIKPEFSETLQTLHTNLRRLLREKEDLEARLQLDYDAPSLGLRSSPGFGMHVHLARAKRDHRRINEDSNFVSINTTTTTRSYVYQEWSLLGSQIFETSMALLAAEKEAFETLRSEVNGHAASLRRNARIMDELDVTLAFANLATEMKFVKPTFSEETLFDVTHGRHPTVELGLLTNGKVFTPNSLEMNSSTRLHIITGPNMAGKSTLLRQTGLIAVLAQTGSFVPADSAHLGIVDKLFSRVGAKDDLFHNRSTFMVEMLETAEILRRATPQSLVIMDEVGRGTTVNDGLAIAYATVHHLVTQNRCRALFATHFHELSDMLGYSEQTSLSSSFESVSFLCTDVDETEAGRFTYSYRVRPGVNRDSHGLKVALLAGMPQQALTVAGNALEILKSRRGEDLSPSQFQT